MDNTFSLNSIKSFFSHLLRLWGVNVVEAQKFLRLNLNPESVRAKAPGRRTILIRSGVRIAIRVSLDVNLNHWALRDKMTRKQFARQPESGETSTFAQSADEAPQEALSSPVNIRVLTHNIRYATGSPFKGEERWLIRCPRLCSELVFNSTNAETFICLQEVLHNQLIDILTALNHQSAEIGGEWKYIGVGREDGKEAGEYSPIFYRPSVWKLKTWDTCWLSETPRIPSKGWDAASTRIATIGQFIHRRSGKLIIAVSTHLDDQGAKSRKEGAKLILGVLDVEAGLAGADAVLLAGDFNSPPDDEAYMVVTAPDSGMVDIKNMVSKHNQYGNEVTFTGFCHESPPKRIDFIFSRKNDKIKYGTYAVLANRFDDGVYSSDHRACVSDLQLLPG